MALEKSKLSEVPEDAIILSEEKALLYESRILSNWPHISDVYGYKYGAGILAAGTMMCGMYANAFFRSKFKLRNYGRLSSYFSMCVVPTTLSVIVHQQFVLYDLILRKDGCPVCYQTRAGAIQAITGCLLPIMIAPVMSLSLVHRYHTYDMPYISKEPMKVLNIVGKQFQKLKNVGFAMFLGQALLGSIVTYLEANSVYNVNLKLLEAEKTAEFAR